MVIAAYNPIIVSGIRSILEDKKAGFQIVGEATNIDSFFYLLDKRNPDIAVVDVGLTWRSGVDFVEEVERRNRRVRIVPISVHPIDHHALLDIKNRLQNLKMPLRDWETLLHLNMETVMN